MAGKNAKVKLNLRGISKVLKAAQPVVDKVGQDIADGAAGNYRYVPSGHRFTARGFVETADVETSVKDAQSAELLRSLGRNIR